MLKLTLSRAIAFAEMNAAARLVAARAKVMVLMAGSFRLPVSRGSCDDAILSLPDRENPL
jgi:hypothetical protein